MVISTKAGSCRCSHVEGPRTQDGGPRTRTRAWARPTTRTNNWRKVLWRPVLHFALDMSLCAKSERQRNGNGIGQGSGWLAKRTLAVTCVCHLVYATVCNCNWHMASFHFGSVSCKFEMNYFIRATDDLIHLLEFPQQVMGDYWLCGSATPPPPTHTHTHINTCIFIKLTSTRLIVRIELRILLPVTFMSRINLGYGQHI